MKTLCIIMLLAMKGASAWGALDLHAHLDLKPGMGPLLQGSFFEAPQAKEWNSRLKTKGTNQSLLDLKNGPHLIVMSFYAHPWLSSLTEALDAEYSHLSNFVSSHPEKWMIAKRPADAREALKNGLNVIVLSIEGADQILETENDFKKWVDERGVAIVTPFHLTEDHLGGVAFIANRLAFFNSPLRFIQSVLLTGGDCLKTFCSSGMGIKPDGEILIQNLIKHKVWIDLAHASDLEISALLPEFEKRNLPLLVTHTEIRETYPAERGLSQNEINFLKKHEGLAGLLPTNDMLNAPLSLHETCVSGLARFKEAFQALQSQIGKTKVAIGSDVNAPITGLSPLCDRPKNRALTELEKTGYYTYSELDELSQFVNETPENANETTKHFLELWESVVLHEGAN